MKKNGFTLVELLGVIAILALLATIATPAIISLSNKIKGNMYDAKVKLIKESAILYAEKYKYKNYIQIPIKKLCEEGFISPDEGLSNNECLENPKNKEKMGNCNIDLKYEYGRFKVDFPVGDSVACN